MTDGERLVWATTYALVFDRSGDAVVAACAAARAVAELREAPERRLPGGDFAISRIDDRTFLDEIVNLP
jgi:hypothetical protein